jgi:hypothetical protein
MLYDLLWFLFEARAWTRYDVENPVWNRLHGVHMFAVVCSVTEFILKFFLLFYVCRAKRMEDRAVI